MDCTIEGVRFDGAWSGQRAPVAPKGKRLRQSMSVVPVGKVKVKFKDPGVFRDYGSASTQIHVLLH